MNKLEKKKIEERRRETSLKTMYFNRFLLIRYMMAVFFFTNLYWLCSLIMSHPIWGVVPGINLMFIILAIWEQCKMYSSPIDNAQNTIIAYRVIAIINIFLIVVLITPLFNQLFPFLQSNTKSHMLILGVTLIGIIFCAISLKKLEKIKNRTDKQYTYVKQLERKFN